MAKSMNLVLVFVASLSVLSFAQQPIAPVQLPPNSQLPPVQLPPNSQLPPVQLPPNSQLPPVQTPPVQMCTPSTSISSLSPCVSYLVGNSSSPPSSCCSIVASLLQSQTPCLCSMLKGGSNPVGFVFNQTQALSLPSICNVPKNPCTDETPNAAAPSVDEPATPTPTPVTEDTPAATATPPVSTTVPTNTPAAGVKATPTTAISGAIRSSGNIGTALFLSVMFAASYMSF